MGEATLRLHADVTGAINGVESIGNSVKELNVATEEYKNRSQDAFRNAGVSAKTLAKGIDQSQSELKKLTQEYLKLSSYQSKWTSADKERFEKLNQSIEKTKNNISQLKSKQADLGVETSKGNAIFGKLAATMAGVFTVGAIVNYSRQAVDAYTMQIRAEAKLTKSLEGRKDTMKALVKQANELERTTLFEDDDIMNAQAMLAINIKDEEQLKKLTNATLDLATAKGMDLASAAQAVNMATMGQSRALKSLGIELDLSGTKTQNVTKVIQALTDTVGGQAVSALSEEERAAHQLQVSMDDLSKSWGKVVLSFSQTGVFSSLVETLDYLGWGLDKVQEKGGRFKDWWNWFFQTGDFGSEVFEMEKNAEKNADTLAKNATTLTQKSGGKTYGDLVNDWIDAGNIGRGVPKAIESLDSLKAKLDELKKAQSAAPLDKFASFQPEIDKLEAQIALYEKKNEKKNAKEKTLHEEYLELRSKRYEEEVAQDAAAYDAELAAAKANKEDYLKLKSDRITEETEADAKLYEDELKALAEFNEKVKKAQEELIKFGQEHPIAKALGITNQEQLDQIKDYVGQLADFANQMIDQQVEATQRVVDDQNQRIEEQEQSVQQEFELKKEGLANNYAIEKENLDKMQKARDEAIKDRERMIKIQRIMSTTESGISLVSAAANIIKGFSGIPVVGVALGLAAVAAMIAGFIAASAKAKDSIKMEEGGEVAFGLLSGRRHSQGGIPIEAEGGEFFTNRQSTQKYLPLLEAINKDDRDGMKLFFDRKFLNKMPQQKLSFDIDKSKKLGEIANLMKKGKTDIIYGPGFIRETTGGYTKIIHLN